MTSQKGRLNYILGSPKNEKILLPTSRLPQWSTAQKKSEKQPSMLMEECTIKLVELLSASRRLEGNLGFRCINESSDSPRQLTKDNKYRINDAFLS